MNRNSRLVLRRRRVGALSAAACALSAAACTAAPDAGRGRAGTDYSGVATLLADAIERERADKGLAAVSVALVDGDEVVWAQGFGARDAAGETPATASTAYRVGSVSKLFTGIALMQLAEAGRVDLDAPVRSYLPGFAPGNDSGTPVTLRHLMAHRSGLVREPPAGHYFDDGGTGLAATVASLNGVPLVYEPGARTKYSNAGIAVAGYVLEALRGEPFARYLQREVLEPLGMERSSFVPEPEILDDLAHGWMWGFDRGFFDAPTFELGMAPAGGMYSTVLDLARFASAMMRRGEGRNGRVLGAGTLESMWEPQFEEPGARAGYGLGFSVRERFGTRWIGHGGAIYGFSTQLAFLPDAGLGVAVASAVDGTNAVTARVADAALELMLAARRGAALPGRVLPATDPIDPSLARALEGTYGGDGDGFELDERNGALYLTPLRGGFAARVRARGDSLLLLDDRLVFGSGVRRVGDSLVGVARRPPSGVPDPPPARWRGLIGEYGWDHNVLYVLEREGRLHALVEWFFLYPLEEISEDVHAFPDWGLYYGERLAFSRGSGGRATSVEMGSVRFERREVGAEAGATFRIAPVRPVEELRAEALAASPPREPGPHRDSELVEATSLDSGIRLDVRYATTDNFMSSVFYDDPRVFLQRPAAEAVARAHRSLARHGYGLLLHDGYRPWYVTRMFWDATPEAQRIFVADPARGSRHNRGAAVDLSLYDLATGRPVDMVGGYDEFSPRSFPDYPGGTSRQRWLRELLRRAMEAEGFSVYEAEWWHFDHEDWREYGIQNLTFDEIADRP